MRAAEVLRRSGWVVAVNSSVRNGSIFSPYYWPGAHHAAILNSDGVPGEPRTALSTAVAARSPLSTGR